MDKTLAFPMSDGLILAQWVVGKSKEQILNMPERFRPFISEWEEDEDVYGDFIRLRVGENYLFCHFGQDERVCTKSILELLNEQITPCREYCIGNYSLAEEEKWINTEYMTLISIHGDVAPGGYVECQSIEGYKTGIGQKIKKLFGR